MANNIIPNASGEMGNPEVRTQRRTTTSGQVEGSTAFQRAELTQPTVRKNGVGGATGMIGTAPTNRGGAEGKVGVGRRRRGTRG
jgi:hypothetical protein